MTDQPFDPVAASAAKEEAMERAANHADPHWWQCMLECGYQVALAQPYFISDDLERMRLHRFHNASTHEHRATGPLMKELQKLGYCLPTQDWVESRQKVNHRRPMRVWFSLIYRGPLVVRRPRPRRLLDPRQLAMWQEELSG